jgi:hypothetical protein
MIDLRRDRTEGNSLVKRVFPQIAHRASEGTFAICQKDRQDIVDCSRSGSLLFRDEGIRLP